MATVKNLDLALLIPALEKYEEDRIKYEEAIKRGENVEPPTPINQLDYVTITVVIDQIGKGAPLAERPDPMGIPIFVENDKLMDEFAAAASAYQRLHDKVLKGLYLASQDDSRPKTIDKPKDMNNALAWIMGRDGVNKAGEKVLTFTHACGVTFRTTLPELQKLTLEKGSSALAIVQMAGDHFEKINAPAKAYDEINRAQKRYLKSRLITEHGEEIAAHIFRIPRADNARAAALVDKDQKAKLAELEKAEQLKRDMAALAALAAEPDPVIDAEAAPTVEPTPPTVEATPPTPRKGKGK